MSVDLHVLIQVGAIFFVQVCPLLSVGERRLKMKQTIMWYTCCLCCLVRCRLLSYRCVCVQGSVFNQLKFSLVLEAYQATCTCI